MIGIEPYPLNRYLMDAARGRRRDHQMFYYEGRIGIAPSSLVNFTAAGQVRNIVINVDRDAPFLFIGLRGLVIQAADAFLNLVGEPDIRVMINYGGPGGKPWAQTPVHWRSCVANRGPAYILPVPKLVDAGSQLFVTLTADSNNALEPMPWNVRLQFMGTKLFKWRAR